MLACKKFRLSPYRFSLIPLLSGNSWGGHSILSAQTDLANSLNSDSEEPLRWIREAIDEAFSRRTENHNRSIFVKERQFSLEEIPYCVFDSTIQDLHFFTKPDGYYLGLGIAKRWTCPFESFQEEIKSVLKITSHGGADMIWLFGGWSFPSPATSGINSAAGRKHQSWKGFPRSEWVIPALTFISQGGKSRLVLAVNIENHGRNLVRAKHMNYYEELAKVLISPKRETPPIPKRCWNRNVPSQKRWVSLVRRALKAISLGDFQKVLLARSLKMTFDSEVPSSTVLNKLVSQSNGGATIFAIRKGNTVFMGATPEGLLSVRNGNLEVDCLAASAPRDSNRTLDDLLGRNLLHDTKSRYEHKLVVEQVTRSISRICTETEVSKTPSVKKFPNIQHLHSTVKGKLRQKISIWSAAQILWPTPATCGEPREASLGWIHKFEGIQRGWYSGVVGYVNASGHHGNLYVSIRSAVIRGNVAALFAGSGIVPGSDPQNEFEETNWKMKTMMNALTDK